MPEVIVKIDCSEDTCDTCQHLRKGKCYPKCSLFDWSLVEREEKVFRSSRCINACSRLEELNNRVWDLGKRNGTLMEEVRHWQENIKHIQSSRDALSAELQSAKKKLDELEIEQVCRDYEEIRSGKVYPLQMKK